jgi:GAF domain-containing protein
MDQTNDLRNHTAPPESRLSRERLEPDKAYAALGKIILAEQPLGQILEQVAHLAQRTVPGAAQVSVTLLKADGSDPQSVAFTGDLAVDLDERQYEAGYGPCMDAAQSGQTIVIDDTSNSELYREFAAACQRNGVGATLSVALPVPQRSIGAINVYGSSGATFDEDAQEIARNFASYAAVALANAALLTSTAQLAEQLETAMASRAVIEQAKGVLIGREGYSPDEAFTALVKQSQRENRKLRAIAEDLVYDPRTRKN